MQRAPSTSLPSQDVMDHSHKESNAFSSASKRDAYMSASGSNVCTPGGFSGRRKAPMRPSMELRCKQLDLSLLQVRTAHDHLPVRSCCCIGCLWHMPVGVHHPQFFLHNL